MSEHKPWPADWPPYYNGHTDPCDMLVGPCCCQAWHNEGEFTLEASYYVSREAVDENG